MSAVEVLAEASWVVFWVPIWSYHQHEVHPWWDFVFDRKKLPEFCFLDEVLKVMKADLTKNFESYGRQVMGFGGSRKSPKNGIPLWENPIKLPPWHSWLLFPSFLWCFTEKDWPCFFWGGMYNDGVQPKISARQRVPTRDSPCIFANGVVLAVAL